MDFLLNLISKGVDVWLSYWTQVFAHYGVIEMENLVLFSLMISALGVLIAWLVVCVSLGVRGEAKKQYGIAIAMAIVLLPAMTITVPLKDRNYECKEVEATVSSEIGIAKLNKIRVCRTTDHIGGTWQNWTYSPY